jgi:hypothetical protein
MRNLAGRAIGTISWEDVDWFVHMRPGWPRSKPSLGDTDRRGYSKPSAVVNISVAVMPLEFLKILLRDNEVSGLDRVKGEDMSRVSVYGGP